MRTNQIETGNLRLASDARTAARGSNLATSAFTLTELLVVITIIAILAALITVAGTGALDKVAEGRIIVEIQQLSNEVEDFKNTYGAYPPNAMIPSGGDPTNNFLGNDIRPIVQTDLQLVMKRAFARNKTISKSSRAWKSSKSRAWPAISLSTGSGNSRIKTTKQPPTSTATENALPSVSHSWPKGKKEWPSPSPPITMKCI